ncbi:hypothetical protein SKAU_G00364120 [Synaphobranchus kaupii]|uniref:Uncharacterized protein n=1 Tax=Synaphobranchus kaupii TaxID=118154 RepID=A0A9Q1EEQ5_SYNKA|nr:hypothetical protein SKAU_G00364120 [Synaphobranchus kaupii]
MPPLAVSFRLLKRRILEDTPRQHQKRPPQLGYFTSPVCSRVCLPQAAQKLNSALPADITGSRESCGVAGWQ